MLIVNGLVLLCFGLMVESLAIQGERSDQLLIANKKSFKSKAIFIVTTKTPISKTDEVKINLFNISTYFRKVSDEPSSGK